MHTTYMHFDVFGPSAKKYIVAKGELTVEKLLITKLHRQEASAKQI